MTTTIFVTDSFVAFHCWPEATDVAGIQRDYLVNEHRHRFGVRVEVEVEHHDREIEFHDLRDHVHVVSTSSDRTDLGRQSCEDIASDIIDWCDERWPGRWWTCTVDEDGECGATVRRGPGVKP